MDYRRYRLLGARYGDAILTSRPIDLFDDAHCAAVIARRWTGTVGGGALSGPGGCAQAHRVPCPCGLRSFVAPTRPSPTSRMRRAG